ncbi:MAG TPA: AAA-like domain-containing protein [Vicinamibacterales bacterium]|nr:AAA-like domain-containing protein [Vicinamibacterales bacterium]
MAADPDPLVHPPAPRRRLDSWKEIADYLRRGLTTVQRWEREEGLPIHRHVHTSGGSVFAYPEDLDKWRSGREPSPGGASPDAPPSPPADAASDVPGGAMPLDSPHYIARAADDDFRQAIARRTSIVLVKGPRQVGKSSLLARALEHARRRHASVVFTDVQALGRDDLRSPMAVYQALGCSIAEQIKVPSSILDTWNNSDSPNTNMSRYMRAVLGAHHHVVWGLDEVDRLVGMDYSADVFGLFRSWHNRRALDPAAPWGRLTLAIAYATEAHLLIADVNQSPFNVGVRVALEDFDAAETMTLNARHGSVLEGPAGAPRLMALVGGNPYLLQCAFYELGRGKSLDQLEDDARRELGPLGEHLRRMRALLQKDSVLDEAMHAVLKGDARPDRDSFYRLRSAGLIVGDAPSEARPRCGLYRQLLPVAT